MKEPNMIIITSSWGDPPSPTFRLIPTTLECPFVEAIFDPGTKILAVISKNRKEMYSMTYKLDDNGDPVMLKGGSKRPNGKNYKEERRLMASYNEYYIEDKEEILEFLVMFASNFTKWAALLDGYLNQKLPPPGEISLAGKMEAVKEEK